MTQHALNPQGDKQPDICDSIPNCPVCGGRMEAVYNRAHQQASACVDCRADLTVPASAWAVLNRKQKHSA